jgi:catechol 2,3-dioxygenase-like lactoylglutathione lyase family enzyme
MTQMQIVMKNFTEQYMTFRANKSLEIDGKMPVCFPRLSSNLMTISEGLSMQCLMDHIVLNVVDDEKMIAFYSKVLMLSPERLEEYRAGNVPFPSVRLNPELIIDLFPKKMWQKSAPVGQGRENLNHFCISLRKETWEDLLERIKANNVDIEEGPVPRWGAHGIGTSIYFRDPEGNLIEARYYESHNSSEKCLPGS